MYKFNQETKSNKWIEHTNKALQEMPELRGVVDSTGVPIESFVFEPSEDAKTIDELIGKIRHGKLFK